MMNRWGLDGMRSFEQPSVAAKEGSRLLDASTTAESASTPTRLA
jgi:biotin synthase